MTHSHPLFTQVNLQQKHGKHCNTLATHLPHTATRCNSLQLAATHCNSLQLATLFTQDSHQTHAKIVATQAVVDPLDSVTHRNTL